MTDLDDVRDQAAAAIVAMQDKMLRDALTKALGRSDWIIADMKDRCRLEVYGMAGAATRRSTLFLDGRPILTFTDPVFRWADGRLGVTINTLDETSRPTLSIGTTGGTP